MISRMKFGSIYQAIALIVLYLSVENSTHNPFILDDVSKIVQNRDIRSISNMPKSLVYPYEGKSKTRHARDSSSRAGEFSLDSKPLELTCHNQINGIRDRIETTPRGPSPS